MATYHFTGVVHPARSSFNLPKIKYGFALPDEGLAATAVLQIDYSMVSVVVSVEGEPNILTLRNAVVGLVQSFVDAYGYISGRSFRVEIVSALPSGNDVQVFSCGVEVLESTAESRPLEIESLLKLSHESPWVRRMLADLGLAIREPADSGFHRYRAIEAIRHHFDADSSTEAEGWIKLRNQLNVTRPTIEEIKGFADPSRHGDWASISDQESARTLSLGWEIAFRFCRYLLGTPTSFTEI